MRKGMQWARGAAWFLIVGIQAGLWPAMATAQAPSARPPVADDAAAKAAADPKVGAIFGCDPDKVKLQCPARRQEITLKVSRTSVSQAFYPLHCLPDNSRPGERVIDAMIRQCDVPERCRNEMPSRVDGCSVPRTFNYNLQQVQALFGSSCVAHDICYNTPGVSKSFCDDQFKQNMYDTCQVAYTYKPIPSAGFLACVVIHEEVYQAVNAFAQSAYDNDQAWGEAQCLSR